MRKLGILLILLLLVGLALAQTTINGSRTITGYWNAGSALWTIPFTLGTAEPATCQVGEVFFDTDAVAGFNVKLCTATNTWTLVQASGSGTGDMLQSMYDPGADGTVESAAVAGTADALSADGTNCSAGQAPLGVDAAGNVQDCWTPATDQNIWSTIDVDGTGDPEPDSTADTLTITAGTGITISGNATSDTVTIINSAPNTTQNIWSTINTTSGTDVAPDSTATTLNLTAGSGISITGDGTATVTIAATGSGGPTTDDSVLVGDGTTNAEKVIPDCDGDGSTLNYDQATNAFSCGDDDTSAGGGDNVSVDGTATIDPNFSDSGDINFTYDGTNIIGDIQSEKVQQPNLDWDTTASRTEGQCVQVGASSDTFKTGTCGSGSGDWAKLGIDSNSDGTNAAVEYDGTSDKLIFNLNEDGTSDIALYDPRSLDSNGDGTTDLAVSGAIGGLSGDASSKQRIAVFPGGYSADPFDYASGWVFENNSATGEGAFYPIVSDPNYRTLVLGPYTDLGTSTYKWRNGYFSNYLYVGTAQFNNNSYQNTTEGIYWSDAGYQYWLVDSDYDGSGNRYYEWRTRADDNSDGTYDELTLAHLDRDATPEFWVDINGDGTKEFYLDSTMTDCDGDGSTVQWDVTTGKFSCGDDDTGVGGGDEVSVDSTATTNPDFQDGGDIDFTYNTGVVTATVKSESVQQGDLDWDTTATRTESQCVQIGASANTLKAGSCGGGSQNLWLTIDTSSGTDVTADNTGDTLALSGGTGITVTGDGTNTVTIESTVTDTDDQALWLTINTSSGTDVTADDSADTLNLTGGAGITITGDGTATVTIASTVTDTGDELTVDDTATTTPDLTDDASSDIDFSYNATSNDITATVKANSVALGTDTTGNYAAGDSEAGNATGVACTDCVALGTETSGNYAGSSSEGGVATSAVALDSDADGTIEVKTTSLALTVDPDENGTAELTIDASGNYFRWDINNDGTTEFQFDADGTTPYFCMDPDDNGNCDFKFIDVGSDATPKVGIAFHDAANPTILHDENAKQILFDYDEDGTYDLTLDGSAAQITLDPNSDGVTDVLLNQTFLQTDQIRYSTADAARMTATNGRMHMCGGNQFAPNAAAGACMYLGGSSGGYASTIGFDPDGDGTDESTISSTGAYSGTAAALATDPSACTAGQVVTDIAAAGALTCNAVTGSYITDGTLLMADLTWNSTASRSAGQGIVVGSDTTKFDVVTLVTASSSDTFTNKTYDAAATGNTFTIEDAASASAASAGQIKIDTTANQLVYYGGAAKVLDPRRFASVTIAAPADTDAPLILKAPFGMTITDIDCIVGAATSAVIDVQECDSAGANCATVDATITCDTDGAADDGTLSNGSIDTNDWIKLDIGTVTGTVGYVTVTFVYTVVQE